MAAMATEAYISTGHFCPRAHMPPLFKFRKGQILFPKLHAPK